MDIKTKGRMLMLAKKHSQDGYIANGLVFRLDGINNTRSGHADTITTWEDLSGNGYDCVSINNHIHSCDSTSVIFNGVTGLDGEGFAYRPIGYEPLDFFNSMEVGTLEVVFRHTDTNWAVMFNTCNMSNRSAFRNYSKGLWYRPASNGYAISSGAGKKVSKIKLSPLVNTITSISTIYTGNNLADSYKNLSLLNSGADAGTMACLSTIDIGAQFNATKDIGQGEVLHSAGTMHGNIYSIRYYNRALTDAERLHNYNNDVLRFGIGG